MKSKFKNCHPLADRHFRQIVCRPTILRKKMFPIWALTWRPGNHTNSFLGNLFRPIGSPLLMVQVSYPRDERREAIALLGVAAAVIPQDAIVSYDDQRLVHDFHRVPYVGARGKVLDPADNERGGRGNGSWVRVALEVDRIRQNAAWRNFRLPIVPVLPRIYYGYARKETARFEVTDELRRQASALLSASWTANSLDNLHQARQDAAVAQQQAFSALAVERQQELLCTAWDAAFISPNDSANTTGLWLLPHELSTDVYTSTRIFEYFGDLIGANIFNPARSLKPKTVPNPSVDVAKAAGIDLVTDLALLATTAEGTEGYQQSEQRLIELIPKFRERLCASEAISDQDLLNAICDYERPVCIEPVLGARSDREQVEAMRTVLKPHLNECCLDADLLSAAKNPNGPLFAAGLCRVQTLCRDTRTPVAESLDFSPELLGRDRLQARLWPTEPLPSEQSSTREDRVHAVAA